MKRLFSMLVMLMVTVSLYSDPSQFKPFSVFLELGFGGMVSGQFYEGVKGSLSPKPDSVSSTILGAGFTWYFLDYFGASLCYDFVNSISADSSKASKPLSIGNGGSFNLFLNGRIPVYKGDSMSAFIKLYAGPSYNYFNWSTDYSDLFSKYGVSLVKAAPGIGFTGGLGVTFVLDQFEWGIDIPVHYKTYMFKISMDYVDVGLNLTGGLDF
jgi:hypothetical protein